MSLIKSSLLILSPFSRLNKGSSGAKRCAHEAANAIIRPIASHRRFGPVKSVWNSDGSMLDVTLSGKELFLVIVASNGYKLFKSEVIYLMSSAI